MTQNKFSVFFSSAEGGGRKHKLVELVFDLIGYTVWIDRELARFAMPYLQRGGAKVAFIMSVCYFTW